jgi:hypothetical protein
MSFALLVKTNCSGDPAYRVMSCLDIPAKRKRFWDYA